jgi:hypothetical protein
MDIYHVCLLPESTIYMIKIARANGKPTYVSKGEYHDPQWIEVTGPGRIKR